MNTYFQQNLLGEETPLTTSSKSVMVRELPEDEQPKNKLFNFGKEFLSNAELLSLLIGQGTKEESEIVLAEKILSRYKDLGIRGLAKFSPSEMANVPGLTQAKVARILAAVELGKRISRAQAQSEVHKIHGPEDVAHYVMPLLRDEPKEHFGVVLLNTKNIILSMQDISIGSLTASVVHPREVFEMAVRFSAASVILVHNHPSGDPSPSREDIAVTHRLKKAGDVMDIPVLDHVIIGDNRFVSLKEKGVMDN